MKIIYNFKERNRLHLRFVFLNLEDHPCRNTFGSDELNATSAPDNALFQEEYLTVLRSVFSNAGLEIDTVQYEDISDRTDLDLLNQDDLGRLLSLSGDPGSITIFFVRSITPLGIQTLSGGNPGPPLTMGTRASGIVVGADTLCYRSWSRLARTTAHAIGLYLGLSRNREPDGNQDTIPDSGASDSNLMFFGDYGGMQLSQGQQQVLKLNPGLH